MLKTKTQKPKKSNILQGTYIVAHTERDMRGEMNFLIEIPCESEKQMSYIQDYLVKLRDSK